MGASEHFFQLMLYMYIVKMKKMYSLASIKGVLVPYINPSMLFTVMRWNQ